MNKKISFGVIAGIFSIGIEGIISIITIPIFLHYLGKDIAGLWVLFNSFGVFINLAQAGLGPVIVRSIAGLQDDTKKNELVKNIYIINIIYRFVFFAVLIVCLFLYIIYLKSVISSIDISSEATIAWFFMSIGFSVRILGMKNLHLINGFGELGWDKILQIATTIFLNVMLMSGLFFGSNLFELSVLYIISSCFYWLGSNYLRRKFIKLKITDQVVEFALIKSILKQSSQILILNIVGFLVMNTDVIIVERMFGVDVLPYYSALVKICTLVIAVSGLIVQMIYPYVSLKWSQSKYKECYSLYIKGVSFSVLSGSIISIIILIAAPYTVPIWIGEDGYLGIKVFGPMLLFALIYIHHNAHANFVLATGDRAFVLPAIINAALSLPLSILGGYIFGISGVVLGNIFATIVPSVYVVHWSIKYFNSLSKIN